MGSIAMTSADTGLDVHDIQDNAAFAGRPVRSRDVVDEMKGMQRIAHAFVNAPESVLQELVNVAVELCGADSAGISLERDDRTDEQFYHWVATAGDYNGFLNAVLPRYPSACGVCLDRGRPQHFCVGQRFFDIMGIEAPLVTDGILLPWESDGMRGTIFVMAHGRREAFDLNDCRLMQVLADFVATGVRQQRQQKRLMERANAEGAAAMANDLAHKINNPLQSLTNVLYLAASGHYGEESKTVGADTLGDLNRISTLVGELLALPYRKIQ